MSGKTGEYLKDKECWSNVIYMPCTAENNFVPELPEKTPDIIYICCPNNPTGTTLTKEQLQKIAEQKMPDLNAANIESAMSMVEGTCRSMGVTVTE